MSTPTLPTLQLTDPATLPDDPAVLKSMLVEVLAALRCSQRESAQLQARLDQLLRRLYGPRSERFDPNQPWLFAEVGADATPPASAAQPRDDGSDINVDDKATDKPQRKGHGRRGLPKHLPRQRRLHTLTEVERRCACCGQERPVIGQETSEQLDYTPASLFVVEHVRLTYACPRCQKQAVAASASVAALTATPVPDPAVLANLRVAGSASTFTTAAKPASPIARGLPGAGLLAHLIVSKFVDHLPLYRLERILGRFGVALARSTLCDWLARCADLLQPLYERLLATVLRSRVLHSDDTPVLVQAGCGQAKHQGRVWVYHGDEEHPHVVYAYSPNRERTWPQQFLRGFTGFLQADAYAGYDTLFATDQITEVACWAHARRKFFEAQKTDPERAVHVLGVVRLLYQVEKAARKKAEQDQLSLAARWGLYRQMRQEKSLPLLTDLGEWLKKQQADVLPKSPIAEAIGYALNQWQALLRYTEHGFLAIDNNAAERALRDIAIGRKNYLFFGSDTGGRTAAILYSFTQTCKELGVEPWRYLRDVLEQLPTCPSERLDELLPDRWAKAQRQALSAPPQDAPSG